MRSYRRGTAKTMCCISLKMGSLWLFVILIHTMELGNAANSNISIPFLQAGTSNYVIIDKELPAGTSLHRLLVINPSNGTLKFSIMGVQYFKNDTEKPVSAWNTSWGSFGMPDPSHPFHCALVESYSFPRNLFCMEPTSNVIKTTSKYKDATKADFSLFSVTVSVMDDRFPGMIFAAVVHFRIRENCSASTREYKNLMTECAQAREIIKRTGTPTDVGFIFTVPNNTKIARITVDFSLLNPFKVIGYVLNYRFTYTSGGKRNSVVLKRRLLVNTSLDRKIAMFLWKPVDIIGDKVNVSVKLSVDIGTRRLSGGGQGIELFLLNRSRNYCENSECVGLYDTFSKSMAANGGQHECRRQDQFAVFEKYSKCVVNKPPTLSIPNIQLEIAPSQGKVIGRIVGTDKEKTSITYGIQWVHSKILRKNVSEGHGFAGRECAEAAKVAAPLSYICVDPKTGEVRTTSKFKYMLRETLTVKVYAIDNGNPRQYSTRIFEINTYDPCVRAKMQYKRLSNSCMGRKIQYITARKNGSTLLFSGSGDRVVRIGINRNAVRFPSDTELTRFTLKQVIYYLTYHEYGKTVSVEYNDKTQNPQNKSDVQLPLVLSFDEASEVELSAESYNRNSTAVVSLTLDSSGIRLYVHSFKATCGSTECVTAYISWVDKSNRCGLDAFKTDPLFVHQYYKICLNPPSFLLHPMSTSVSMNSVVQVYCIYNNFTAVEFQWIKDGSAFKPTTIVNGTNYIREVSSSSSTVQVLRIRGAEPDLQGYFHCMIKDALSHTVNSTKALVRFRDVSTSRMELSISQPFSKTLQNKASPQYKKLSADVANALQNMLDRNSMHKQRKIVIREFQPGSVVASVYVYYVNVTDQIRRTLCNQFQSLSPSMRDTKLDILSVDNISFDCCYKERTGEKNIKGIITWKQMTAGSFDKQACPYRHYKNKLNSTVYKASRFCQPNFIDGAHWQAPEISECAYRTKTTSMLEEISKTNITDDNVEQIAGKLNAITSNKEKITNRLDVKFTADAIESLVNSNKNLSKITKDVINVTSNMMDFDDTYVANAQVQYKSSSKVLGSLDKLALQLELLPNVTVNVLSKNLALAVMPIVSVKEGIAIKSERDPESGYNYVDFRETNTPDDQVSLTDTAQIWLPELLFHKAAQLNQESFNRIYSFVFDNDQLFIAKEQITKTLKSATRQIALGFSTKINSRILSASIGKAKLENLTLHEEMQGRFRLLSKHPGEIKCVYWDFRIDGFGAWSSNGCRSVGREDSIQKCRCNHLTNFAILLDVPGKGTPQEAAKALSIITYIGCAISLLCLLITLTTFALFKKLREKRPARILMGLCSALVLTIITFLLGIQANDKISCQVFALLIHYFVLASFMWMAVEGLNHYLCFVRIVKDGISRFMLKSNLFAWGASLIIVAISAAATKLESHGKKNKDGEWVCMVTGMAFHVAYLVPILLVVTTNLVVLGFVINALKNSNKVSKDQRMTGLTMARMGAACSVLMGTTWIIGFFAVDVLTIPMQLLFCIFNSLQGFFIFIFYCARNNDARKQWTATLWSRDTEDTKSKSLGGNRYKMDMANLGASQQLIASTKF